MLAVIELGGKQYNVSVGTKFSTEKIDVEEGKTFDVEKVLLVSDDEGNDCKIGMPLLKEKVVAKVISHGKGDKIRVFKMKAKKRYQKTQGHRQLFTEVEIVEIAGEKTKTIHAKKTTVKKTPAKTSTIDSKTDKIDTEVKKPAAKKTTAAKKTPAKKEEK